MRKYELYRVLANMLFSSTYYREGENVFWPTSLIFILYLIVFRRPSRKQSFRNTNSSPLYTFYSYLLSSNTQGLGGTVSAECLFKL